MGKATRVRVVADDRVEPTPEQLRQNRFALVQVKDPGQAAPIVVRRNLTARNLERWFHQDRIDETEFRAGEMYRSDYELAGWQPSGACTLGLRTAGAQGAVYQPPMPRTLVQIDADKRYTAARLEIDPALRWGFDMLILFDKGHSDVPAEHDRLKAFHRDRWGVMISLCLGRLVRHYRL